MSNDKSYDEILQELDMKARVRLIKEALAFTVRLQADLQSGKVVATTTHFGQLKSPDMKNWMLRSVATCALIREVPKELATAYARGETIPPTLLPRHSTECPNCGTSLQFYFDGKVITTGETVCPFPDGVPAYSMEFDCPSGKMVFGNDFRPLYRGEKTEADHDFDINTEFGLMQEFLFWASLGMAHGFVSNTCPKIWQHSETKVGLWTLGIEDEDESPTMPEEGVAVGQIITNLWWYSVADHDDYLARGGEIRPNREHVVVVEPGRYRVTHKTSLCDLHDWRSLQEFATFERIGDCQ